MEDKQDFNDFFDQDPSSHILRFEEMLEQNKEYFFDVEEFENIIDHYLVSSKLKNASWAAELGCSQHPDAIAIKLRKAQVMASCKKPQRALQYLNEIEVGEPWNPDLHIVKGNIFSQK